MSDQLIQNEVLSSLKESVSQIKAHDPFLSEIEHRIKDLAPLAQGLDDSWSGIWMKDLSTLYYNGFRRPPFDVSLSQEWGVLYGIPDGWFDVSFEEIVEYLYSKAPGMTIGQLEQKVSKIVNECNEFKNYVSIELFQLEDSSGYEGEAALAKEIDDFTFGISFDTVISTLRPGSIYSRDAGGLMGPIRIPPHKQLFAKLLVCQSKIDSIRKFVKIASRMIRQIDLKKGALSVQQSHKYSGLDFAIKVCQRFHWVAKRLAQRYNNRLAFVIADEYDVQDLLHALLRVHFDDIRKEEHTGSFAGSSGRADFLLKGHGIVVEAKYARANHSDKEIGKELIDDIARYSRIPGWNILVCLIYNPTGAIVNPRGLEQDLSELGNDNFTIIPIICPLEG